MPPDSHSSGPSSPGRRTPASCRRAAALSIGALAVSISAVAFTDAQAQDKLLIGHRGASAHAPENTLEAFETALTLGADVIELDVQFSRDHVPVVIHDETLERTTNVARIYPRRARQTEGGMRTWYVRDFLLRDLRHLDAGGWYAESFKGARIPTLAEALRHINGRAAVIVDFKPQRDLALAPGRAARGIAAAVATLDRRNARDWIAISSFDRRDLQESALRELARFIASDAPPEGTRTDDELFPDGLCGVSISRRLLRADPDLLRRARERGRLVLLWAFDAPAGPMPSALRTELVHAIHNVDVDGLITNRVEEFRAVQPPVASRVSWAACFGQTRDHGAARTPTGNPVVAPSRTAAPRR